MTTESVGSVRSWLIGGSPTSLGLPGGGGTVDRGNELTELGATLVHQPLQLGSGLGKAPQAHVAGGQTGAGVRELRHQVQRALVQLERPLTLAVGAVEIPGVGE